MKLLPGLLACVAVAIVATLLGMRLPVVGGAVFAIAIGLLIGLLIAALRAPSAAMKPGIAFSSKVLLQISIVLLGANLSIGRVIASGARAMPVTIVTLIVVLAAAYVVGKALGIDRDLRRLLGVGTGICGGSAIAAVSSAIDADGADIAYAMSTIFLFNVIAVLTFPWLGHLMNLSQHAFGLWAGTAINDTSSVVAAGYAYGHDAGDEAVIVKLTRTLLIVPLVGFYAYRRIAAARGSGAIDWWSVLPWFVLFFVAAAAANGFGLIPDAAHGPLQTLALFCITVALAGVGLSADYAKMRAAGLRPLLLGFILWATIAVSSLGVARLIGL
ncbi:MAG TPA: putative sulfate exporter family transporter [Candidatus Baltobacteraceae bacterium]